MAEPEKSVPPVSVEDFEANYTPQGGLKSILDYYTKEDDVEEPEKKDVEEPKPSDPPSPAEEVVDEEFKDKKITDIIALIKQERTSSTELKAKHEAIEAELKTIKENPTVADEKFKAFLEDLRKDPVVAWKKHGETLQLPNVESFKQVINTGNDTRTRLKYYQENELKNKIEEKFALDKGTFKFDADEAENPDKPSYEFRRLSRIKEQELESEVSTAIKKVSDGQKLATERQAEDKKWYADTFLGGDLKKADEAVKALSSLPEKILKGEVPPYKHPFSVRTMLLGVNHDALMAEALEKQKTEIMEAYAKQGFELRTDKLPESLKHIKKSQAGDGQERKEKKTGIPGLDAMNAYN